MSMSWNWRETTIEVYLAIYKQHKDDLRVFESFTDMGDHGEKLEASITAWGFANADHPLIKSELSRTRGWQYFILERAYEDE